MRLNKKRRKGTRSEPSKAIVIVWRTRVTVSLGAWSPTGVQPLIDARELPTSNNDNKNKTFLLVLSEKARQPGITAIAIIITSASSAGGSNVAWCCPVRQFPIHHRPPCRRSSPRSVRQFARPFARPFTRPFARPFVRRQRG
jgi:hypothetical protein